MLRRGASATGRPCSQPTMSLTTLYATPTPKFESPTGARFGAGRRAGPRARRPRRRVQGAVEPDEPERVRRRRPPRGGGRGRTITLDRARTRRARADGLHAERPVAAVRGDRRPVRRPTEPATRRARSGASSTTSRCSPRTSRASPRSAASPGTTTRPSRSRGRRGIAESIGNLWGQAYAAMNAYEIHLDRGEVGTAVTTMRDWIDSASDPGSSRRRPRSAPRSPRPTATWATRTSRRTRRRSPWRSRTNACRRRDHGSSARSRRSISWVGELDRAEAALADSAVDLLPEPLRSAASIKVPLVRGSVADARGDHDQAIEIADAVLDRLRRAGLRPFVAEAMLLKGGRSPPAAGREMPKGSCRRRAGRPMASGTAGSCGRSSWRSRRWSASEERPGMLGEARLIVRSIADGVEEDLRRSFLARPDVRRAVEGAASPSIERAGRWTRRAMMPGEVAPVRHPDPR